MPRCTSLIVLVALVFCPIIASAADSTAMTQLVAGYHFEDRFNGAVLVAEGDEIVYQAGFGEADRTWHVANRPDTVFLVGSISKQFTAMLILQLAAEGKLSLQDPLSKHLPDYPEDKANVTLHQLLCHSSGLPHYGGLEEIGVDLGDYLRLDRPVAEYVDLIGGMKLRSAPGEEHSYSSMGYIVLAYIAEQVSGKSYGRLIEERIARPLGVSDLGFAYGHEPVERLAHGYEFNIRQLEDGALDLRYEPETYRDQSNTYSTGGVHASALALFRWARALAKDELLDAEHRELMWTPQIANYGYGWRIDSGDDYGLDPEVEVISHGGSLSGYQASIVVVDRGRYTLIALGNSSSSRSSAVTQGLAQLLHGVEPEPPNILGTALAWRMVRDGEAVGRAFFQRQKAQGYPGYVNNDFAFYAFAERFAELERPDLGLTISELGLEAHPESAMLHLGVALNHRAADEPEAALAAAEKALALIANGSDGPGFVESHARELIDELEPATRKLAVGDNGSR